MLVNSDFHITVLRVLSAGRVYSATGQRAQIPSRGRWALALKTGGATCYYANGREIRSDSTHIVLLPKGSRYSWQCTQAGECLILDFEALEEGSQPISFPVADSSFFVKEFRQIRQLLHTPVPGGKLEAVQRLYTVLLQLLRASAKEYTPSRTRQLLQPAVQYLTEHYFEPDITNDRLASLCGISSVYFRKRFEAAFGMPPIRYLHRLRIQNAKDILASDYGSVTRVAESVGYASVYHFSKMFKLYTGQSPMQFAKECTQHPLQK